MKIKHTLMLLAVFFLGLIPLSESFTSIQKPVRHFDSDNYLIVDGKSFFPIGIYSVNLSKRWDPPSAFEEIKAAGFNTVHTYEYEEDYLKEFTKKAESADLKVLIYPGSRMEQPDFNMDSVKSTVRNLRKSSHGSHQWILHLTTSIHIKYISMAWRAGFTKTAITIDFEV